MNEQKWEKCVKPLEEGESLKTNTCKPKTLKVSEVEIECRYATDKDMSEIGNLLEYGRLMDEVDIETKGENDE